MALHLVPEEDAGEHWASEDCWCLPVAGVTARPDGFYGRVVEHRRESDVEEITELRSENA